MLPAPLQQYEFAIQCKSSSRVLMLQAVHSLIFTFEQRDEQLKSFSSTLRTNRLGLPRTQCPLSCHLLVQHASVGALFAACHLGLDTQH